MGSTNMQGWMSRGGSRLAGWLSALLLVLHGATQFSHHLPNTTLRPLSAALAPDSGPIFRPFGLSGHFPSVRSDARPLAGPPERAAQDPPTAIPPIAIALTGRGAAAAPWLDAGQQSRPKVERPFEARAPPPTTA